MRQIQKGWRKAKKKAQQNCLLCKTRQKLFKDAEKEIISQLTNIKFECSYIWKCIQKLNGEAQ